jgi:hypothetical protein
MMKEVMSTCPVLALLDFTRPFVLECDASGEGIGAVLMQQRHPIAYKSIKLIESERLYSVYDKEMLTIMHALEKFRQYLVGGKFVVNTDHNSLRHILGKKELNERKHKWVSKLQAYAFDIKYVKGKKNVVVDAFSRKPKICSLVEISVDWKSHLLVEYSKNKFACDLKDHSVHDDRYKVVDDIIYYKYLIYLVLQSTLKEQIMRAMHDTPLAGHQGYFKTYMKIKERFTWKGLKDDSLWYVSESATCQQNNSE